jgi:hypothetical protein
MTLIIVAGSAGTVIKIVGAEANEREYKEEASCLADARHTLVYKQLLKKAPREAGLRCKKILRLRVVNASRVTIPY